MLKITVNSTLEKAYEFIDNRLVLQLAEKKLRVSNIGSSAVNQNYIKQNIQNTVVYLEKEPKRSTLVIITNEKKGNKIVGCNCAIALREKNPNEFDLYIELLGQAVEKGIISRDQIKSKMQKFSKGVIAAFCIIGGIVMIATFFISFPLLLLCFFCAVVWSPFAYLKEKKKFKHNQKIMNQVVSIFEAEFPSYGKTDTKDWVNYWGRVKTNTKDFLSLDIIKP